MTWGRLDDSYDGHRKRRLGSLAADGLLSRAIAHAAKHETDGFVDRAWVEQQGKTSERRRALREALKARLLEEFPAGEVRAVRAPYRKGVRDAARDVTVGPFEVDGYLVHDFLDFNPAAADLTEKRAKERRKKSKPKATPKLWNGTYAASPDAAVPPGIPPLEGEAGKGSTSGPSGSDLGRAAEDHARAVVEIVDVFDGLGLGIDEAAVSNAIARFPGIQHVAEARGCAEYLRAHPDKPSGHTLHRYFERAKAPAATNDDTARRAAALAAVVERGAA